MAKLAGRARAGRLLRASDDERERAVVCLRHHFADGRIAADELEQRVERAYTARTRGDLSALMRDLPSDARRRAATGIGRWRRAALRMHVYAYATVTGTLVGIWALTGEGRFWPAWVLLPATALLGWHVFGDRKLGRALERRAIRAQLPATSRRRNTR